MTIYPVLSVVFNRINIVTAILQCKIIWRATLNSKVKYNNQRLVKFRNIRCWRNLQSRYLSLLKTYLINHLFNSCLKLTNLKSQKKRRSKILVSSKHQLKTMKHLVNLRMALLMIKTFIILAVLKLSKDRKPDVIVNANLFRIIFQKKVQVHLPILNVTRVILEVTLILSTTLIMENISIKRVVIIMKAVWLLSREVLV